MVADLTVLTPSTHPRLVIKVGSSLLVAADGTVRREWLTRLVADIAARKAAGQQIVIVSSGAIALGARRLGLGKGGRASLEDAQAAAATGQIALASVWADLLGERGITAAQMLVTLDDLEDRRRFLNASATLDRLLTLGAVPVVNENDSVATTEIRFGDNDRLAARVAQAAGARGVVLLSDVDGLYTANPHRDMGAQRLARIEAITPEIEAMASSDSASGMGSGGMASKLQAAKIATVAGADLIILSGLHDHPLARMDREDCGTLFVANKGNGAKKGWLAGRLTVKGRIHVDAGAADALRIGKSLLAAGVARIEGRFERGDVVDIVGADDVALARGLAEYDSRDAAVIAGLSSAAIATALGAPPRAAFIHRDHLVML